MTEDGYVSLAVVVRHTETASTDPSLGYDLHSAFTSFDEATDEAARLNAVADGKRRATYFVRPVRFYPTGRDVQIGY